jgi:hypothetical protein
MATGLPRLWIVALDMGHETYGSATDRYILDGVMAREAAKPRERYKRRAPLHILHVIPDVAFEYNMAA